VLQPLSLRVIERHRRAVMLAAGAALTGLGFSLAAVLHTPPGYAVGIAVWTFGEIAFIPIGPTVVADLAPAELRGSYQGVYQIAFGASAMVAPMLGAFVLGRAAATACGAAAWAWAWSPRACTSRWRLRAVATSSPCTPPSQAPPARTACAPPGDRLLAMRRKLVMLGATVGCALVAGWSSWRLVSADLEAKLARGGRTSGEYSFLVFFTALGGLVGLVGSHRLVRGAAVVRREWLLGFEPGRREADYRSTARPIVSDLSSRLRARGYVPVIERVDDAHVSLGPAAADLELGGQLRIVHGPAAHKQPDLGIILGFTAPGAGAPGFAFVMVSDGAAGLYVEMAHYLFIALGDLHPGLTFRDLASTAGAQSARDLASVLPDRPEHLPGPA